MAALGYGMLWSSSAGGIARDDGTGGVIGRSPSFSAAVTRSIHGKPCGGGWRRLDCISLRFAYSA